MRVTKQLRQRILDGEYPKILTKKDIKAFEKTGELTKEQETKIMMQDMVTLKVALNSPAQHRTVELGIKEFKRRMKDSFPFWTRGQKSEAIALYKKKAWLDFEEMVGFKGSFPTVPAYKG
jgi:hypothetical protein